MSNESTTQPAAKLAPTRPRAQLGGAALGSLMAAAGTDNRGDPIRIPLADIDEDPNQPRRTFDQDELESLAESIRLQGVIQAIVVRPAQKGRYTLAFGARRFRASKLAGVKDIPAIVRPEGDDEFAAQVIENTQRSNLTNSELAAAVLRFVEQGKTSKQIAAICNLRDYQVAAFRKVADFPGELRDRIDRADMRALYDLYRVWNKGAEQIGAALAAFDAANPDAFLTITEARRIVSGITGKPTGSIVLDRAQVTPAPAASANAVDDPSPEPPARLEHDPVGDDEARARPQRSSPATPAHPAASNPATAAPASASPASAQGEAPVFIVSVGNGIEGRLVVDRRAEKAGRALVELDGAVEEVDPAAISLVRIE
ncbi:ParB/RepB/Spo0J family partition protein [Methylobacterium radiotolerans]|uniref:ParB/RepB/Spo0J family partition protein n=1 Tax=Methylobacterium radiotolerans TaxID=31998 RepID=UPI00097808D5|nr:ParB/RepB/Spo0J family partition protein [Methylobacterium radiotolerans]